MTDDFYSAGLRKIIDTADKLENPFERFTTYWRAGEFANKLTLEHLSELEKKFKLAESLTRENAPSAFDIPFSLRNIFKIVSAFVTEIRNLDNDIANINASSEVLRQSSKDAKLFSVCSKLASRCKDGIENTIKTLNELSESDWNTHLESSSPRSARRLKQLKKELAQG